MTTGTFGINTEVTLFLNELNHPFRNEIEELRNCILSANNDLSENIKWNGPNYCFEEQDRITMKIQPPARQIMLIFHTGTKKQDAPTEKLIPYKDKLLVWKENNRAIVTFKSLQEIESQKSELTIIISQWLNQAREIR